MTLSISILGCGRMGSAMVQGWLRADPKPEISVFAPRPTPQVSDWVSKGEVALNPERAPADILVLAVKPQVFGPLAEETRDLIGPETLVVSVMAGWSIDQMADALGTPLIVRALPSTPGAIGKGVTLLSAASDVSDVQLTTVRDLVSPLGWVEGPMSEETLQTAMTISGSGPAYVFHLVEAMAEAGVANGLEPELSSRLARLAVIGAGALLESSEDSATALREAVTSPKGVTAAALGVLMGEKGVSSLMKDAIANAVARDKELAGGGKP